MFVFFEVNLNSISSIFQCIQKLIRIHKIMSLNENSLIIYIYYYLQKMIPSSTKSLPSGSLEKQKVLIDSNNIVFSCQSGSLDCTVRKLPDFNYLPQQDRKLELQKRKKMLIQQVNFSQVKSPYILNCKNYEIGVIQAHFYHENIDFNLAELLKKQTKSYSQKITIFYEIVEGVKALHNERICYRNICPENIALKENQGTLSVKLMNFSKAQKTDNFHSRIQINQYERNGFLKSIYNAPQITLQKYHSLECDVWSLGVLLYEMLFREIQNIQVLHKHVNITFPEQTPEWLQDFIETMLNYDPLKRHKIEDIEMIVRSAVNCSHSTDIKKKMI